MLFSVLLWDMYHFEGATHEVLEMQLHHKMPFAASATERDSKKL